MYQNILKRLLHQQNYNIVTGLEATKTANHTFKRELAATVRQMFQHRSFILTVKIFAIGQLG